MPYTIWLEFEQYNPRVSEEPDGFCNISVTHDDGRHEGYSIWTIDFFRERILDILSQAESDGFATLPDIILTRITREHITAALK